MTRSWIGFAAFLLVLAMASSALAGVTNGVAGVYRDDTKVLEVFWSDATGTVRRDWKENNGDWYQPSSISAIGAAPPNAPLSAVTEPINQHVEIFFVDAAGAITDIWKQGNHPFSAPLKLTASGTAIPGTRLAAVWSKTNEHLEVFWVDQNGAINEIWKEHDTAWRAPGPVTGRDFAVPGAALSAVATPMNEHIEVFGVDGAGALSFVWKEHDGAWKPFGKLSGPNFATPGSQLAVVFTPLNEHVEVFGAANDGTVNMVWKEHDTDWKQPTNLSGPHFVAGGAALSAVWQPVGEQLEVFGAGADGAYKILWKNHDTAWLPPSQIGGPGNALPGAPLAAIWQDINEQIQIFSIDGTGALTMNWKQKNDNWQTVFRPTRAAGLPWITPGQCTAFLKGWARGAENDSMVAQCGEEMGIVAYCYAQDQAMVTGYAPQDGSGLPGHDGRRFLGCSHTDNSDDSVGAQFDHIVVGVSEGLETALIASAPYLTPAIEGVSCAAGVIYSCAVLAVDIASRLGVDTGPAKDIVQGVDWVVQCAGGDVASCAQAGVEGANKLAGWSLPGENIAQMAVDAQNCINGGEDGNFLACVELGEAAVDAAGVHVDQHAAADAAACLDGDAASCVKLGEAVAAAAGLPLGGVLSGEQLAEACSRGDVASCQQLGLAAAQAAGASPTMIAAAQDAVACANDDRQACLAMSEAVATDIGVSFSGIANAEQLAEDCAGGNVQSCVTLARALAAAAGAGKAASTAADAAACAGGDTDACLRLPGEATNSPVPFTQIPGAVQLAAACQNGDLDACKGLAGLIVAAVANSTHSNQPNIPSAKSQDVAPRVDVGGVNAGDPDVAKYRQLRDDIGKAFPASDLAPSPHIDPAALEKAYNAALIGSLAGDSAVADCAPNWRLVGVDGQASGAIHRIQPICVQVGDQLNWIGKAGRVASIGAALAGDSDLPLICPPNSFVGRMDVAVGSGGDAVSSIRLTCVTPATGTTVSTGPLVIGPGKGAPDHTLCEGTDTATGIFGAIDASALSSLGLRCAPTPTLIAQPKATPVPTPPRPQPECADPVPVALDASHLWQGVWDTVTQSGNPYTVRLTQTGSQVTGCFTPANGVISDGRIDKTGRMLTFHWEQDDANGHRFGGAGQFRISGRTVDAFAGSWTTSDNPAQVDGTWNGTRDKSAAQPLPLNGDLSGKLGKLTDDTAPAAPIQQTIKVTCVLGTEDCGAFAPVVLDGRGNAGNWQLTLKAPDGHCSSVSYIVTAADQTTVIGRTPFLAHGESAAVTLPGSSAPQTIEVTARGVRGGCNTGVLSGWGLELTAAIVPN